MKCLMLSTPDLRATDFLDAISPQFKHVVCPKLDYPPSCLNSTPESLVYQLHYQILQDHQKRWFQAVTHKTAWFDNTEYQNKLNAIIDPLGEQSWLIHDPLIAQFLPLWTAAVDNPLLVFYYSEPLECAAALQHKWRFPMVFGLALWESFVLSACKNINQQSVILVSSYQLRNNAKQHLKSVCNEMGMADSIDVSAFSQTQAMPVAGEVSQAQKQLFSLLENNQTAAIAELDISDQSKDILDYYGQLRSGYEKITMERDQLKTQIALLKPQDQVEQSTEQEASLQEPSLDEGLYKVRVHIEGMEVLEFYSEPSSPVLDMLQGHLASNAEQQLVYLNYGADDDDTIYFMSSDLLAIETKPSDQQ